MIVTRKYTKEERLLMAIQSSLGEILDLAKKWLVGREEYDFTNDDGTAASGEDVLRHVVEQIEAVYGEVADYSPVFMGDFAKLIEPPNPELIQVSLRQAAPIIAAQARAGLREAIEKNAEDVDREGKDEE